MKLGFLSGREGGDMGERFGKAIGSMKNLMLIDQVYARIGVLEVWEDSRGYRYASIRNRTYESIHPVPDNYKL